MKRLLLPVLLLAAAGCTHQAGFLERSVTLANHQYHYRVWLPPHYTKLHHWPVILFLHGSGERGDDNLRQIGVGLGPALLKHGDWYRAVVILPQCADGQEWYGDQELQALAALEETIREFHGDRRRVYLTGVSMGGAGTWYMARHRRLFAALVPVSSEVVRQPNDPFPSDPPPDIARILGAPNPYARPVWVFHGSSDNVIPVTEARNMVAALQQIHGRVKYTEYRGVGHDCWDLAYGERNMVTWLFQQRSR